MIRLIVILCIGSLAWMIWWAVGQGAYERGLAFWIDERRTAGWAADVGGLNTRGFPNRFDTTLTDLRLADPKTGVAWSAPEAQILSLAYKPHQVIAVLPQAHRFSTPFETVEIAHEDARASLFLKPETSLGLESARLVAKGLTLSSSRDWQAGLAEGRFAFESVPAAANTYRAGADITDLSPSVGLRRVLDPAGALPDKIEQLRLDAVIAFDRPWDRFAIETARPQPTRIKLDDLSANWGTITFRAVGAVAIDAEGYPTGDLTIRAVEWRRLLEMAVTSGALPRNISGPLERALELMSGPRDTLDAKLTFKNRTIRMGILPLGPAPRIVLR